MRVIVSPSTVTVSGRSSDQGSAARRWSSGGGSCSRGATLARSSGGTIHEEMDVANDLPLSGPSGTYSKACTSRALQSLSRTKPKMRAAASSIAIGSPGRVEGPQTKPSSHSKSRAAVGRSSVRPSPAGTWPWGRLTSVPLTTIVDARPW